MTDLKRLADYFGPDDIEWKPITISKKTNKGLAAAYVTNRAVMDRLDEVCGPENWRNEYVAGPDGGVLCGISIRIGEEWVTKWDGAENSDIEPVKGGLSNAMRRAAVQWGIGRYLYDLPSQWVPVDERGRFINQPQIPAAFLPKSTSKTPAPAPSMDRLDAALQTLGIDDADLTDGIVECVLTKKTTYGRATPRERDKVGKCLEYVAGVVDPAEYHGFLSWAVKGREVLDSTGAVDQSLAAYVAHGHGPKYGESTAAEISDMFDTKG